MMGSERPNRRPNNPSPGSDEWKALVYDGAEAMGIFLDGKRIDRFAVHAAELLKWNQKINLTSITDPREIAVKHFLDSIAPVPLISEGSCVLDIGSGAGFPGIPIKIVMPSLVMTLIDSSGKKVNFLKHIIRTLELADISAHPLRVEELPLDAPPVKGPFFSKTTKYDVVMCRALSSLATIAQKALPLITQNGTVIALKGKITRAELDEARHHVQKLIPIPSITVQRYALPFLGFERAIVCMTYGHSFENQNKSVHG